MKRRKVFGSLHGKTLEEWTAEEEAKLYASPKMQAWQENCEAFFDKDLASSSATVVLLAVAVLVLKVVVLKVVVLKVVVVVVVVIVVVVVQS